MKLRSDGINIGDTFIEVAELHYSTVNPHQLSKERSL